MTRLIFMKLNKKAYSDQIKNQIILVEYHHFPNLVEKKYNDW